MPKRSLTSGLRRQARRSVPLRFCLLFPLAVLLLPGCRSGGLSSEEGIREAYEAGLEFIAMYDLNRANPYLRKAFNAVSPEHPLFPEIGFSYAVTLLHFTPVRPQFITEGEAVLTRVIEVADGTELGQVAKIELGRSLESVNFQGAIADQESARVLYSRAYEVDPNSVPGVTALIYLAMSYLIEFENPASVRLGMAKLSRHLDLYPDTVMESILWQMLGDAHIQNFGEHREALAAYKRSNELGFIDRPLTDRFKWRMADWAVVIGEYEEAIRVLTSIIEDTPRSPLRTQARQRIEQIQKNLPRS